MFRGRVRQVHFIGIGGIGMSGLAESLRTLGFDVSGSDLRDGSFLRLTPTIAAVSNIDPEHLDFHGSYQALKEAFATFVEQVPFYGLAVLCLDHPRVQELLPAVRRRHVTYGVSPQASRPCDRCRAMSRQAKSAAVARTRQPLVLGRRVASPIRAVRCESWISSRAASAAKVAAVPKPSIPWPAMRSSSSRL